VGVIAVDIEPIWILATIDLKVISNTINNPNPHKEVITTLKITN
jgi:hypothetical protein